MTCLLYTSYMLAKRYPIAAWSGKLGPKEKEGDRQTPEGFYEVEPVSYTHLLASRMVIDNGFRIRYYIWLIAYFISVEKITSC